METNERILAAAERILERKGGLAVSLRAIAKVARITPMAIYHHFPDRTHLLRALVDREILRFVAFIRSGPTYRGHESRLIHSGDAYIGFALRHPLIFNFLFAEPRAGVRQYPADLRTGQSPSLNLLADVVREAIQDGYLRPADVWDVTFQLWAHSHGYAMLYLSGRVSLSEPEFLKLVHQSLRRTLHGLKK